MIFLSHSFRDIEAAQSVCAALESDGNRCWIAKRDTRPGEEWGGEIMTAIESCELLVLVFSAHSRFSPQVRREVDHAAYRDKQIVVIRVDSAELSGRFGLLAGEFSVSADPTLPFEDRLLALCRAVASVRQTGMEPNLAMTPAPERVSAALATQALIELLKRSLKANYWIAGLRILLSIFALIEFLFHREDGNVARTYIAFSLPMHFAGAAWLLVTLAVWLAAASKRTYGLPPAVVWRAFLHPIRFWRVPGRLSRELLESTGAGKNLTARSTLVWRAVAFAQALALSVAVIGGVDSAGPLLLIPDLLLTVIWCLTATAAVSFAGEAERLADLPTQAGAATEGR